MQHDLRIHRAPAQTRQRAVLGLAEQRGLGAGQHERVALRLRMRGRHKIRHRRIALRLQGLGPEFHLARGFESLDLDLIWAHSELTASQYDVAVATVVPFGENDRCPKAPKRRRPAFVEASVSRSIDRLTALRRPSESYSDVILRLAAGEPLAPKPRPPHARHSAGPDWRL
jgi:hypothetical protein